MPTTNTTHHYEHSLRDQDFEELSGRRQDRQFRYPSTTTMHDRRADGDSDRVGQLAHQGRPHLLPRTRCSAAVR